MRQCVMGNTYSDLTTCGSLLLEGKLLAFQCQKDAHWTPANYFKKKHFQALPYFTYILADAPQSSTLFPQDCYA